MNRSVIFSLGKGVQTADTKKIERRGTLYNAVNPLGHFIRSHIPRVEIFFPSNGAWH